MFSDVVTDNAERAVAEDRQVCAAVCAGCSPLHMQHRLLHSADLSSPVLQTHLTLRHQKCTFVVAYFSYLLSSWQLVWKKLRMFGNLTSVNELCHKSRILGKKRDLQWILWKLIVNFPHCSKFQAHTFLCNFPIDWCRFPRTSCPQLF